MRTAFCAVVVLILAGCSSSPPKTFTAPFTPEPLTSPTPGTTFTPGPPFAQDNTSTPPATDGDSQPTGVDGLDYIGSLKQSWTGASTTAAWSIASPSYGDISPAPADVRTACNVTSPAQIASTAFIRASLTVTFTGQITTSVLVAATAGLQIGTTSTVAQGAYIAFTDTAGITQWDCGGNTQSYSMPPGSSVTLHLWILVPGAVTNQNPHPAANYFAAWNFGEPTSIIGDGTATDHVSGPHAATCDDAGQKAQVVSLFLTPPYRYGGSDGQPAVCSKAN